MQIDFHYYATYCAAFLAGHTHEESYTIAYSAQLVDLCTKTLLKKLGGPLHAATTQLSGEMMDAPTDIPGLQDITRIWASFHFLPGDLYAACPHRPKRYQNKYRLICKPNSALLEDTVNLTGDDSLQAEGIAMHVLADTWAHQNFAGTPSLVINNMGWHLYKLTPNGNGYDREEIKLQHSTGADDIFAGRFNASLYQGNENSIMNLGHGRIGHLPDYSFMRYAYLPAWGDYEEVIKDNPSDYYHAFCQLVYAMQCLREKKPFKRDTYAFETVAPYEEKIRAILEKWQPFSSDDFKAFGESLSSETVPDFDLDRYQKEYMDAPADGKDATFLGRFFNAALKQKSLVVERIYASGNMLAGYSLDIEKSGLKGIKDYHHLVEAEQGGDAK